MVLTTQPSHLPLAGFFRGLAAKRLKDPSWPGMTKQEAFFFAVFPVKPEALLPEEGWKQKMNKS